VREWLEVNLRHEYWITATETQGRFGGGQGQEFTQHYQIQYWRDTLGTAVHPALPDTVLAGHPR
jgi:discoidin domain receptor family protein 2